MPAIPSAGDAPVLAARLPSRRLVLGGLVSIALAAPAASLAGALTSPPTVAAPVAPAEVPADWTLTIARGSTRAVLGAAVLARFPSATVRAADADGTPAEWSGVLVADLLAAVGATASARLRVHTMDSSTPIDIRWNAAEHAASVVAIARDGRPLVGRDGSPAALALGDATPVAARLSLIEVLS